MDNLHSTIDRILPEIIEMAHDIFKHPELGYREMETRKKVIEKLDKYGIEHKDAAYTGIVATLDSGKPGPNIGLVAEFDAIPVLGHPYSNPEQLNAAHSCGHYAQIGNYLALFIALKESGIMEKLCGKVTLLVTPAEEFCDFEYRKELIKKGVVKYASGKQQMIYEGCFDDVDLMLNLHSMINGSDGEIGCNLNGFMHKEIYFHGKASHAGAAPEKGVNALNALMIATNAIAYMRETFTENDRIRVHYVVKEGGQTVNSIPSRTEMEMYIRAATMEAMLEVNKKVDNCLKAGALATGCSVEIEDTPGYFPLVQDPNLCNFVYKHLCNYFAKDKIVVNSNGMASSDVGDLSLMWPIVQIGMAGFAGTFHGKDFREVDEKLAYYIPNHYHGDMIYDLLSNNGEKAYEISKAFKPEVTKEQYFEMLEKLDATNTYSY